jgi:hypothetical protein
VSRRFPRRSIPLVWATVNEPSVDASSITLTGSALVEMDMQMTMPKTIMDDLMIMNGLETNSGITSWSSFGDDSIVDVMFYLSGFDDIVILVRHLLRH